MDTLVLVAIITGGLGFLGGLISTIVVIFKQVSENKKTDSSIVVDASTVATNIVDSAGALTGMYKESLKECHDQIVYLENKMIELENKVNIGMKMIQELTIKDEESTQLIFRLLQGVRVLIKQMKELNITPKWVPLETDLQYQYKE